MHLHIGSPPISCSLVAALQVLDLTGQNLTGISSNRHGTFKYLRLERAATKATLAAATTYATVCTLGPSYTGGAPEAMQSITYEINGATNYFADQSASTACCNENDVQATAKSKKYKHSPRQPTNTALAQNNFMPNSGMNTNNDVQLSCSTTPWAKLDTHIDLCKLLLANTMSPPTPTHPHGSMRTHGGAFWAFLCRTSTSHNFTTLGLQSHAQHLAVQGSGKICSIMCAKLLQGTPSRLMAAEFARTY
jgi:hypothetical protein